jgi:hypothetical protein
MSDDIILCSLWFNSSKEEMRRRLKLTQNDAGVGITVGRQYKNYFAPQIQTVQLEFDDGTHGKATVKKPSWDNCPHLIDHSIGCWARQNGLWEEKLKHRNVTLYLKVIKPNKVFRVTRKL